MTRPWRDRRGRLSRPRLPGEAGDPVPVGDAAAIVGAELGLGDPLAAGRLASAWPELVGPALAAHSRVRRVRGTVLELTVDSPAWATEVRYLEDDLVERASRLLGAGVVTEVRVSVQPAGGPGEDTADPGVR